MTLRRGVADVDRGDRHRGWLEVRRAVVQGGSVDRRQHAHQARDRVVGEVRIGAVPLLAHDIEHRVQAAASADLDHFAQRCRIGRLADQAGRKILAAFGQAAQHLFRAIDRRPLFVAGDQQADRTWACSPAGVRGSTPPPRRSRRWPPSCPKRPDRRGGRRESLPRTDRRSRRRGRREAPRRCGRQSRNSGRRRRNGHRDCRPSPSPLRRTAFARRRSRAAEAPAEVCRARPRRPA